MPKAAKRELGSGPSQVTRRDSHPGPRLTRSLVSPGGLRIGTDGQVEALGGEVTVTPRQDLGVEGRSLSPPLEEGLEAGVPELGPF